MPKVKAKNVDEKKPLLLIPIPIEAIEFLDSIANGVDNFPRDSMPPLLYKYLNHIQTLNAYIQMRTYIAIEENEK